jgi:hypothetical protein
MTIIQTAELGCLQITTVLEEQQKKNILDIELVKLTMLTEQFKTVYETTIDLKHIMDKIA